MTDDPFNATEAAQADRRLNIVRAAQHSRGDLNSLKRTRVNPGQAAAHRVLAVQTKKSHMEAEHGEFGCGRFAVEARYKSPIHRGDLEAQANLTRRSNSASRYANEGES